jgi:hypothetical protein
LGVLALCIAALGFGDAHRVASSDGSSIPWQMFGAGGAKYDDVAQGELGTCYFLAAVSAIAHRRPDLIQAMFVEQQLWKVEQGRSNPVYTTEWFINGEKLKVAVDGKVPVDSQTRPFFVKTHHGADAWPLVFEKAWAKIFGSFSAVSGGNGAEVYKAITQAPVERRPTIGNKQLWEQLTRAAESNWPMTGAVYKKIRTISPSPMHMLFWMFQSRSPTAMAKESERFASTILGVQQTNIVAKCQLQTAAKVHIGWLLRSSSRHFKPLHGQRLSRGPSSLMREVLSLSKIPQQ